MIERQPVAIDGYAVNSSAMLCCYMTCARASLSDALGVCHGRLERQVASALEVSIPSRAILKIGLVYRINPKILDIGSFMCYENEVEKPMAMVHTINVAYSSTLTFSVPSGGSGVSVVH